MTHPQKHIEALEKSATESELISQLTPNKNTQRANQGKAAKLRSRIDELNKRLRKLAKEHP